MHRLHLSSNQKLLLLLYSERSQLLLANMKSIEHGLTHCHHVGVNHASSLRCHHCLLSIPLLLIHKKLFLLVLMLPQLKLSLPFQKPLGVSDDLISSDLLSDTAHIGIILSLLQLLLVQLLV